MTKKPPCEDFKAAYAEANGNKILLAEKYNCSVQSIYNWYEEYINEVEGKMQTQKELDYEDYVRLHNDSINKMRNREVDVKLKDRCLIIGLSDFHLGSNAVDVDVLNDLIDFIAKTPNVYAIYVGDITDYTPSGHKELAYEQVWSNPKFAKDWAICTFRKINHKMLAMVSGCHDDWEYTATGEFFGDELAKNTVTKIFVPDTLMMNIKVGKEIYPTYVTHKLSPFNKNNPSNAMFQKARSEIDFEIGFQAHMHTTAIAQQFIRNKIVTAINCGSIKKGDMYCGKLGIINNRASLAPAVELFASEHWHQPYMSYRETPYYKEYLKNKDLNT